MIKLPYKGSVYISSPYGERMLNGSMNWHSGLDLVGKTNKIVYAPCDGIIGASTIITDHNNTTWEWGNYIRLDTYDGYNIFMCHLSKRNVVTGQKVKQGEPIGVEGNTGYSFGSHCHFEIRKNGCTINPCSLLEIKNLAGVTYDNVFEEADDMTKEEVISIIKEYEESKKKSSAPKWSDKELNEAIKLGITDGKQPMEDAPRYQVAIMCKRVFDKIMSTINSK